MITKTACLAYSQYPERLWLFEHQPHLATASDSAAQRRYWMYRK